MIIRIEDRFLHLTEQTGKGKSLVKSHTYGQKIYTVADEVSALDQ